MVPLNPAVPKLKRGKKAAFDLLFIVCDGFELFPLLFTQVGTVEPKLVFFLIVPHILRSLRLN